MVSFVWVKLVTFSSHFEKFYFSISTDQNLIIDLKKYNWTFQKDFPYNLFSLREKGKYPTLNSEEDLEI